MSIDKKILSTMQEENDMTQKEAGSTGKRHLHSTLFIYAHVYPHFPSQFS